MKHDTLATLLVALLFVSAVAAAGLSLRWFFSIREMQELQWQVAIVNNSRAAVQALANDVLTYSRENPGLDPILQEFNIRQPGASTTNQPAAKPSPK